MTTLNQTFTTLENFGHSLSAPSYRFPPKTSEEIYEVFQLARKTGLTVTLRGAGRSYNDASLNGGGIVLDMTSMNQIVEWDASSGVVRCDAGVTLEQLWHKVLPDGWWPPVVSGTMYTTLGGCLGANIHGKNNFRKGTIGEHVIEFDAILPTGAEITCSPKRNADLFYAIISGLGMLGVITRVTLQMIKIESGLIEVHAWPTRTIEEQIRGLEDGAPEYNYIVGWLDTMSIGHGQIHAANYITDDPDPAKMQVSYQTLPDRFFGGLGLVQAVAQHQRRGKDLGDGVGDPLAGDIRGAATGRFVEAEPAFADTGRCEKSHGAGDHGTLVGDDVTEHIAAQEHVELVGVLDQLHGGVVHINMAQRNVRIVLGRFGDHFPPQHHGGQDVGLVHGNDLFTSQPGGIKGCPGNALDFPSGIDHGIEGTLVGSAAVPALGLSKIDVPGQFPHTQDIKSFSHDSRMKRAGAGQGGKHLGRPQVAKQAKMFAKGQQGTALGLLCRWQVFPLGAAHGPEKNGIAGFAEAQGLLRQGLTVAIDGNPTDIGVGADQLKIESFLGHREDLEGLRHHFGTDAIARQYSYFRHMQPSKFI